MPDNDSLLDSIKLAGLHNRQNSRLAVEAIGPLVGQNIDKLIEIAGRFPGTARRFEQLSANIYSDYAHTPEEIMATMEMAREISDRVVVAYEPLTNRRQHYMKDQYNGVFESAKQVYWLPSYLAREDPNQKILSPAELITYLSPRTAAQTGLLDDKLKQRLLRHAASGDLVICMAGGGGSSLDEWARQNLTNPKSPLKIEPAGANI